MNASESELAADIALIQSAAEPGVLEGIQQQAADQTRADAEAIVQRAEDGDVGAPFEPDAQATLRTFRAQNLAGWMRLRGRLKSAGTHITELEKALSKGQGSTPEDDQSVADRLIALARAQCELVHDPERNPYAIFISDGARQVYALSSSAFSDYLSHLYYKEFDRAPTETSIKVALATLRGQAVFEGETREVFTRIAKTSDAYWLDLCNDAWQCVRITSRGWSIVSGDDAPLFTRSPSMHPLPAPQRGGTLDALWPLVNIPVADRLMVLTWLLECLRGDTPHVVLELVGEQGSAKSSTQRALRRLIDPNQSDLRAAPKSVGDVWINAQNSHLVSLENLSHLDPRYQDALCVLATGGGYSTRKFFTNTEESIIDLRKPVVLNGISVIVTAQDLLDRCLHLELPTIQSREQSSVIEARYDEAQPELLGALLDLFAKVLALLPSVQIAPEQRPRMADFANLGEAVFRAHGQQAGAFLARYGAMRKAGVRRTLDASPVGAALTEYLAAKPEGFCGPLAQLLVRLDQYKPSGEAWPRSPKGLGDALRRLAPALRLIGYECKSLPKTGGVIWWQIFLSKPRTPDTSPGSPASPDQGVSRALNRTGLDALAGHSGHPGHEPAVLTPEKNVLPGADDWQDQDSEVF